MKSILTSRFKRFLEMYTRSQRAYKYALSNRTIGIEFATFGRNIGLRLVSKLSRGGFKYFLTPVQITRYFEFPFVLSCVPNIAGNWLDVSSPRLFSLYAGTENESSTILIINPDEQDINQSSDIAKRLSIKNLRAEKCDLKKLAESEPKFDCIWSISVIEHISGDYDDRIAIKMMYDLLSPGGRLILTVPVDRQFRDEYRETDVYGLQSSVSSERYFFQRIYDAASIQKRLIEQINVEPTIQRWFGERIPGTFDAFEQRWIRDGFKVTVDSPREITDNYCEFDNWDAMPGFGVCGLMFEKAK